MLLEESEHLHLTKLKSADERGRIMNRITRRRKALSAELIYVSDKL
jgi:hypothetical protein